MTKDPAAGMITRVWGPSLWLIMHVCSMNFPLNPSQKDKSAYLRFYKSLQDVLPCSACRKSYTKLINSPHTRLCLDTFNSRTRLVKWVYKVHCAVNDRLCKLGTSNCKSPSLKQVVKQYEKLRANSCSHAGCDKVNKGKRKRAVILIVTDEQYKKISPNKASIRDITGIM